MPCNLKITETVDLGMEKLPVRKAPKSIIIFETLLYISDILQLVKEPAVYPGELMYPVNTEASLQCLGDGEDTHVGGVQRAPFQYHRS